VLLLRRYSPVNYLLFHEHWTTRTCVYPSYLGALYKQQPDIKVGGGAGGSASSVLHHTPAVQRIISNLLLILRPHKIRYLARSSDRFILRHHTLRCLIPELTLHRGDMGHRILPVEIWKMIFEFATACPEEWEFNTWERYGVFQKDLSGLNNTIRRWKCALKTRHSLVAVSWFFNQLTTPLLYQSFFAIGSRQVSLFRFALETRPAFGNHIKRLSLSAHLEQHIIADYPVIQRFCPNIVFYDAALRRPGLKPAPSLRSLELLYSPRFNQSLTAHAFLHLLTGMLQTIPQLEHLGLHHLPVRIKVTNSQPFVSIRLESLRTLHLRVDSRYIHPPSTTLTVPLFSSWDLPRLEDLLLDGGDRDEGVHSGIPAVWLQKIRQFNVTHGSIISYRLDAKHFHQLRKLTLDFSFTSDNPRGKLHEKVPLIQLEEIVLVGCMTSILCRSFGGLYLVFCLCADDTVTPKLRCLSTDIIKWGEQPRFISPERVNRRLNELQSVVKRIIVRGIEPKGLESSSLRSVIQKLIETTETWMIADGWITDLLTYDDVDSWESGD